MLLKKDGLLVSCEETLEEVPWRAGGGNAIDILLDQEAKVKFAAYGTQHPHLTNIVLTYTGKGMWLGNTVTLPRSAVCMSVAMHHTTANVCADVWGETLVHVGETQKDICFLESCCRQLVRVRALPAAAVSNVYSLGMLRSSSPNMQPPCSISQAWM